MKKLTACFAASLFCSLAVSTVPAAEDTAQDSMPLTAPNPIVLDAGAAGLPQNRREGTVSVKEDNTEVINCLPSPIVSVQNGAGTGITAIDAKTAAAGAKPAESVKKAVNKSDKLTAQNTPQKCATKHNSPPPAAGVGRQIQVKAYAYCIHGRTASGTRTGIGTIAVDPSLIPLGSKMYIPGYGWGTALDTGGNMRGRVIDIWYPSNGECMNWGVRNVTVTVLPR